MPTATTWWWLGIGAGVSGLATTGTVLIVRGRRRAVTVPPPDLGIPPRRVKPAKRKPKILVFTPPEPEVQERSKSRSGSVVARDDPGLGYTDYFFNLYKLPSDEGQFEVGVCVGLQYTLDKLTWDSILTPTDEGPERLFLLQDLNLKAALTLRGRWEGDRIVDLEADEKSLLCAGYNMRFPQVGAYFDILGVSAPAGLVEPQNVFPSWGGTLRRKPMPGEKWGNGYLPRFGVRIEDDRLKLRIQVAPMVKAHHNQVGPTPPIVYTAQKATYHYEYTAKIEFLEGIL